VTRRSSPHFPVLALVAITATAGLSFVNHSNLAWGFNVLHFYQAPFRIAWSVAAAIVVAAAWWIGRRDFLASATPFRHLPWIAGLALAAISGVVFHLFHARTGLTGRGTSILINLRQGLPATSDSPAYNAIQPVLTAWLKGMRSTPTLEEAGRISVLAGALTVGLGGLWLLSRLRSGRSATGALAGLLLLQPATLVFYGHVDSWSLGGAFFLALLFACHAILERRTESRWRDALVVSAGLLAIVGGLFLVSGRSLAELHFTARPDVTSGLNATWFLAAPALLLILSLAFTREGRRALGSPAILPGGVVFLVFLAIRLFARTDLGAVRDWSFFSPMGFGLTAVAAAALAAWRPCGESRNHAEESAGDSLAGRAWRLPGPIQVAAVSAFFLVPLVGMEAHSGRAVARHLAVVDGQPPLPPRVAAGYHAAMGDRFLYLGNNKLAARAYERAYSHYPDPLLSWRSGLSFLSAGQLEEAGAAFRETTRRNPSDWQAWSELGNVLCGLNLFDQAEETLRHAIMLNSRAAPPRVHLARTLGFKGLRREARLMLESARPLLEARDPIVEQFRLLDTTLPSALPSPG
jgi:hypothetical protein